MNFIDLKNQLNDVSLLLSHAMGDKNKIAVVIEDYLTNKNIHCIGIKLDNNIIGLIGIEISNKSGTIRHMVILPYQRKNSYGKKLIQYIIDKWNLNEIFAETDIDAVEFYRKLKFDIISVQGKYNMRYRCHLKIGKL